MSSANEMNDTSVVAELGERGLLLLQDKKLGNAIRILTGDTVTGSWWSHPKANAIYAILERVTERPDVLVAKLVSKKITLVHRRLWPAVLAVATGREAWQLEGLSAEAKRMLTTLDQGRPIEPAGAAGKEIELRLLAHAAKVHTASGKHVTKLEAWSVWAQRNECIAIDIREGKRLLESALASIGGTPKSLPWKSLAIG